MKDARNRSFRLVVTVLVLGAACGGHDGGVDPNTPDPGLLNVELIPQSTIGGAILEITGAVTSAIPATVPNGIVRIGMPGHLLRILVQLPPGNGRLTVATVDSPNRKANTIRVIEVAAGEDGTFLPLATSAVSTSLIAR